ncbi:alpha/beta-hydrolase [Cadophora sp. DSE1049]|nr:alpha/beta-hydrolase [Cadophora sp. DSE1049]
MGPKPDPEFEKILKSAPQPPLPSRDIHFLREQTNTLNAKSRHPIPAGIKEYKVTIPVQDGSAISAQVYKPSFPQGKSPLYLAFHGGGYCIGSSEDESETNRALALELGFVVVSVEYRLAPEQKFPTCVYDGFDALKWVAANAASLDANLAAGLIVGGVSSGGNIAMAVIYLNRDNDSPVTITGQFLSVANVLPPPVVPEKYKSAYKSVSENKDYAIPPAELIEVFMGAYQPDLNSPLFVPFNHPNGHKGIPATYMQVCELDDLRDEELIYERVLREEAGIHTRLEFYEGLPHHFWEFFPTMDGHVKKRVRNTVAGFKWLLDGAQ